MVSFRCRFGEQPGFDPREYMAAFARYLSDTADEALLAELNRLAALSCYDAVLRGLEYSVRHDLGWGLRTDYLDPAHDEALAEPAWRYREKDPGDQSLKLAMLFRPLEETRRENRLIESVFAYGAGRTPRNVPQYADCITHARPQPRKLRIMSYADLKAEFAERREAEAQRPKMRKIHLSRIGPVR